MEKGARSLCDVHPGETVKVRLVLFDSLRAYCADLGLHDGDRVILLEEGSTDVVVRGSGGIVVRCPSDLARFVEAARDESSAGEIETKSRLGRRGE